MSEVQQHLAKLLLSGRGAVLPTAKEQEEIERMHQQGVSAENATLVATVGELKNDHLLSLFGIEFSEESGRSSTGA